MIATLTIDDLQVEVRSSPRRKSLQLTVGRFGELVLSAPEGTSSTVLERFVREKQFWLYTKLAEKESLQQPKVTREFVSGESFPYLGRSYRLRLVNEQGRALKLEQGRFKLRRSEAQRGREHFIRWYTAHARPWLALRMERFAQRVGPRPVALRVFDLGFRWGSRGKGDTLNFHWASILLPPRIIDYVIVHEFVHLVEENHTPEFWQRVERAMPDFEDRKRWLAQRGGEFVAL